MKLDASYKSLSPANSLEDESSYILTMEMYKTPVLRGYSLCSAAVFITSFVAGMGVLAMPHALAGTGWYGVILIFLACTNSWYSSLILGRSWLMLEERWEEYRGKFRYPYPAIGMRAVGPWMRYVITFALNLSLIGTAVVYILVSAGVAESLTKDFIHFEYNSWILILAGILCLLSWLGSIEKFWFAAMGALLAASLVCISLLAGLLAKTPTGEVPTYGNTTFSTGALSFGTVLFSVGGSFMCPTIQNDMADRKQFHVAALIGYGGIFLLYLPVTIVGYAAEGYTVPINILEAIEEGSLKIFIEACLAVHAFLAFLLAINPVAQEFEELFHVKSAFNYKRCIIRSLIMGVVLLIAYAVPHFDKILNLVGGSAVTLLAFIFPPIFYFLLCRDDPENDRKISMAEKIYLIQIIVTGIAGGIACTYFALLDIIHTFHEE